MRPWGARSQGGLDTVAASLTDHFETILNLGVELLIELKPFEIALSAPLLHQLEEFNGAAAVRIVLRIDVHMPLVVVVTRGA